MRKLGGAVGTTVPVSAEGAKNHGGADRSTGRGGVRGLEAKMEQKGRQSRVELMNYQSKTGLRCTE